MKYPKFLLKGDTIGVCAPSNGVPDYLFGRLERAEKNVEALGYKIVETESVRKSLKCVSASSETRAKEFMQMYKDNSISAIIPPWGGEFLMDMLPYLDLEDIKNLPPKWIVGYSDLTTLLFVLTIMCDIATVHGSNLMNMGFESIHPMDLKAFEVISKDDVIQESSEYSGGYTEDYSAYALDKKTEWKNLYSDNNEKENTELSFSGRMIGGCMDVLTAILGTKYTDVASFLDKYKEDGFIWTLESCEMKAPDIYRTLWKMRECGWFKYCKGILIGRPDGYEDKKDFTLKDALTKAFEGLNIPVIYDTDIGHLPPQIQIVNGSYGTVNYSNGKGTLKQVLKV